MNILDIKNILDCVELKHVIISGKKPYLLSKNKKTLKDFFIKTGIKPAETIFLLKHKDNLEDLHIFCKCGNKNNFIDNTVGYHIFCCNSCSAKFSKEKAENTKLLLYGDKNYNNREKAINTYKNKFGGNSPFCSKIIRKKADSTKQIKYGDKNYNNREKAEQTCIKNHGVKNPRQMDSYIEKRNQNDLKKYGVPYYTNREKAIKTSKNNVDENGLNSYQRSVYNTKQCFKNKIGVDHYMKEHINHIEDLNKEFFINNFILNNRFDIEKCAKYFNVKNCWAYKYKNLFNIDCICKKNIKQHTVYDFIKSIYNKEILFNTRKVISPMELDIYIPEKNVAIEFNGIYWHSSANTLDYNYHQQKSKICYDKNIRLIHVYEDEWDDENKREIIKDIIKHALNIKTSENKIYARKCIVKEIDNNSYNNFCNKYHIQGTKGAQIKLGLFYNNELVQIASFGKSRFDKKYEWEWIRGCPASNNNVIGGTSKLFKYFIKKYNPKSVLCYADFNKFDGRGYKECGFKFVKLTAPDKFYFDIKNEIRINRSPKKYKEYMKKVKDGEFLLLYGAGNLKFEWFNSL